MRKLERLISRHTRRSLILTFFTHSLVDEEKKLVPQSLPVTYRRIRNFELLASAIFIVSIIPVFWSLGISVGDSFIRLRYILWILTLFLPRVRHLYEARKALYQKKL